MKVENVKINEENLRKLYLKKLALGEYYGPLQGKISLDRPYLKFYSDEDIMKENDINYTLYEYMMKNNKDNLDEKALYYGIPFGKDFTFEDLDKRSNEFRKSCIASNLKESDIITNMSVFTPEVVFAFYGANRGGYVSDMIHPLSSPGEIKTFLNATKSKLMIVVEDMLDKVVEVMDETSLEKVVVISPSDSMNNPITKGLYNFKNRNKKAAMKNDSRIITYDDFIKEGSKISDVSDVEYKKDNTAVILHTGGTNGQPKGVELTNENFNSLAEQVLSSIKTIKRKEKLLTVLPPFHGFGLAVSMHLPLSYGMECILIPKYDSKKIGKVFKKYEPNFILGVPTLLRSLLDNKEVVKVQQEKKCIHQIICGGDTGKKELIDEVKNTFGVDMEIGYGLTEAVACVTYSKAPYNDNSSIGIPLIDTEIKVVDPITKKELGEGEVGELWIKSKQVMNKSYNSSLDGDINNVEIEDGWLNTKDVVKYENDQIYFHARKSNLIISSGVNVYPSQIEQVIEEHPDVLNCAVIAKEDKYKGQVPKAFVVLKNTKEDDIKDSIIQLCRENVNKYSIPTEIEFIDELPKTKIGKIDVKQLREMEKQRIKVR